MADDPTTAPEAEGEVVSPDKLLAALYKSDRPAVELLPGVTLSAIINSVWLHRPSKVELGG